MVAILEDLDLQIDESAAYNLEVAKVQRLIRDKIDALKESAEESRPEVLYSKALAGMRNYAKSKEGEKNERGTQETT